MSLNTQLSTTSRTAFLAYSEAMTRRTIDGETLKFNKGDFLAGKLGVVVPIGTELVAVMNSLAIGYLKWKSSKPVDSRMGLLADGFQPPRRSELDEYSSDTWETGSDGDIRDPWQFTNTIVLIDPATKAIYTFSANSRGGLDAIGKLCRDHAKKSPAGTYPVIRLEVGSYQHRDKTIGRVKFPIFEVIKFVQDQDFDSALAALRGETEALTAPTEAPAIEYDAGEPATSDDAGSRPFAPLDDDIPFAPEWR